MLSNKKNFLSEAFVLFLYFGGENVFIFWQTLSILAISNIFFSFKLGTCLKLILYFKTRFRQRELNVNLGLTDI